MEERVLSILAAEPVERDGRRQWQVTVRGGAILLEQVPGDFPRGYIVVEEDLGPARPGSDAHRVSYSVRKAQ